MTECIALLNLARIRLLVVLAVAGAALVALPATASAFTQADVDAAINKGVSFYDGTQNADGSWGSSFKGAETALALASYGVADGNQFANLTPAQQTRVQNGVQFLLGTQQADGSFDDGNQLKTYETGLGLLALSLSTDVPTTTAGAVATAISNGRTYLFKTQNIPPNISCQSTGTNGSGLGGQTFCGGWDYGFSGTPTSRSDESNTGFAITGLELTGGLPADVAAGNEGWQRNIQQLTSNPGGFPARNDGGGSYEPGISSGSFSSNSNDTGSMLFGFGFDGVPASDPAVQAGLLFGNDIFDTFELNKATRDMIYHSGQNEDGSCVIGSAGCQWNFSGGGEGGYHYSMFALVKGMSQYIAPDLNDPSNFYAKAVDLLLSEQAADGSWPQNGRDDGSVPASTGFAILALAKVGAPPGPPTPTPTPTPTPPPATDTTAPRIRISAIGGACRRTAFRVSVTLTESGKLRSTRIILDGKEIGRTKDKKFTKLIPASGLSSGRHTIRFVSVDRAGNRSSKSISFTRCARAAKKKKAPPRFTG